MASQRQAAIGVFWGTLERAATQGISFIVVLILARILGPANYGLVTLAATIALLGQTLLGETFSEALIQWPVLEPEHSASIFWLLVGVGFATGAAVFASADWFAALFSQPALAAILRALSPLLLLTALQAVPIALFKRELNFRALAAASTTGTALGGIIGVALAFAGYGPWSLVANLLVQNTVVTATIWRKSDFRPARRVSRRHLRELWSYGQFTLLLRIALFTANQSPRLLIGYLFGTTALGAFGLAQRITDVAYQLFIVPAANVAVPVIARVRSDPPRLERAVLSATQMVAAVAMPVFTGLALTAPFVIPLIFGARWAGSVNIVQLVALSGIVGAAGYIYRSIVGGLGRPAINLGAAVVAAVLSVGVLVAAAPWGVVAASAVFVIRGCLTLPLQPILVSRLTHVDLGKQYQVFAPVIGATLAMAIAVETVIVLVGPGTSPVALSAVTAGLGAVTYLLALYLLAPQLFKLCRSVVADLRARRVGEG